MEVRVRILIKRGDPRLLGAREIEVLKTLVERWRCGSDSPILFARRSGSPQIASISNSLPASQSTSVEG